MKKTSKLFQAIILSAVLVVFMTINSALADAKTPTATINISNFAFSPSTLTIKAGTKVTWTNKDDTPHSILAKNKKFNSPTLNKDSSFSYTFKKTGTYKYICGLHPSMAGKIVVKK